MALTTGLQIHQVEPLQTVFISQNVRFIDFRSRLTVEEFQGKQQLLHASHGSAADHNRLRISFPQNISALRYAPSN